MGDKDQVLPVEKYSVLEELQDTENPDVNKKQTSKLQIPPRNYRLGYVLLITILMSIGSFIFGYTMSIVSGVTLYIDSDQDPNFKGTTNQQKELIVSFALIGATIGSIIIGPLNDWIGRKPTIMLADTFFIVGAIVMYTSVNILWLVLGRLIVGLAAGAASMSIPIYLAEMSPTSIRGAVVTTNILFATFGQLMSLVLCYPMRPNWRLMLGFTAFPAIVHLLFMIYLPESVRFLMKKGKSEEAKKTFGKIYDADKPSGREEMDYEIKILADGLSEEVNKKESTFLRFKEVLMVYRRNLLIGIGLQVAQQFAGINTALYYGPQIMLQAGFGNENNKEEALLISLPLFILKFIGTAFALIFVDRMGRRYIMMRGLFMCTLGMIGLASGVLLKNIGYLTLGRWLSATFLFFYLWFFSIGMGPQPWTVNSEIYPIHLRGTGNAIATMANWLSNYTVSAVFLTITSSQTGQVITYYSLALFSLVSALFIYFYVPETKGKTLNEILDLLVPPEEREKAEKRFKGEHD